MLRKLWTDLEPDEAPVVLVVGSETETGQVVLRRGAVCSSKTLSEALKRGVFSCFSGFIALIAHH